jgi:hypothetical protein
MAGVQDWSIVLPATQRAEFTYNSANPYPRDRDRILEVNLSDGTTILVDSLSYGGAAIGPSNAQRNLKMSYFYWDPSIQTPAVDHLGWMQPVAGAAGNSGVTARWWIEMDDSGTLDFSDFIVLLTFYDSTYGGRPADFSERLRNRFKDSPHHSR